MARKKRDPVNASQLSVLDLAPPPPQPSRSSGCLSCLDGCAFCQPHRFLDWPSWFKPAKSTPRRQTDNVQKGKHPTGHVLASGQDEGCGQTCGSCGHLAIQSSKGGSGSFRCDRLPMKDSTRSIRKGWAGCEEWKPVGEEPVTPSPTSPRRG